MRGCKSKIAWRRIPSSGICGTSLLVSLLALLVGERIPGPSQCMQTMVLVGVVRRHVCAPNDV